jgi:hypothetical protein
MPMKLSLGNLKFVAPTNKYVEINNFGFLVLRGDLLLYDEKKIIDR